MMSREMPFWKESEGFHRLFPYAPMTARSRGDGAPGEDLKSFPGFSGPIPVAPYKPYHAYRVINPAGDAKTLSVELTVPRAPSRLLRFVGPDGRPVRGVTVAGLLPPPLPMTSLEGSEAEALALDPSHPRPLLALSHDGRYFARDVIDSTGVVPMPPKTIVLEPAGSVSGRLVDAATGRALSGYTVWISPSLEDADRIPGVAAPVKSDIGGRFLFRGVIPDIPVSVTIRPPTDPKNLMGSWRDYRPDALRSLTLRAREARDLGDVRIRADE